MKYFISQPMNNLSDEEIKAKRKAIEDYFRANDEDAEFIDSFLEGAPHGAEPLWFLGKSLMMLAEADIAVFADGWLFARGCKIEYDCAQAYGIKSFVQVTDDKFREVV